MNNFTVFFAGVIAGCIIMSFFSGGGDDDE